MGSPREKPVGRPSPWQRVRALFRRETLGKDAAAGLVLGVESVPDGLALGLLAGVNPVAGLYAYLFGMAGAAFFTSSTLMAVQGTGAMSLIISDSDLGTRPDPDRALFTLAMLTGVVLIVAGVLRAGRLLRFVPTSVMVGFITAVGVNIVLGQLTNLTGYRSDADNRVLRTLDLLLHPHLILVPTLVIGLVTIALVVVLTRTRLRSLGLVIAVAAGSALAVGFDAWFGWEVPTIADITDVPSGLPVPVLPTWGDLAYLAVPALSLAFVAVVQSAAVTAAVPNPDGRPADSSRNIVAQGVGNVVSGVFRGMPVGGSMSASVIVSTSGARTRLALFIASAVMALVIVFASGIVAYTAMPALAGLLIVIGVQAVKPTQIRSVAKSGPFQAAIMAVTFALTLIIPLQFAVLVGVGLGVILFVAQQSNRLRVRQIELHEGGRMRETDPVAVLPPNEVVVLQPFGSMFFASAPTFAAQLPKVDARSQNSVVILRLRGIDEIGLSSVQALTSYLGELERRGSMLWLVIPNERMITQLRAGGLYDRIGSQRVYQGTEWHGETVRRARDDALAWIRSQAGEESRGGRGKPSW